MNENSNLAPADETPRTTDNFTQEADQVEQNQSDMTTTNVPVESEVREISAEQNKEDSGNVTDNSTTDEREKADNVIIDVADFDEDDELQETEDIVSLTKSELIDKLKYLIDNKPANKISQIVEDIRSRYNELVELEAENERAQFIEAGNDDKEFTPSPDPTREEFALIINTYRSRLKNFREQSEKEKEDNLVRKQEIIKAIENLINTEESLNKTFNDFHKLQEEWRSIGLVPQSAIKHLYETYHHHVERFYDFIKINKDLRELDLKKNLEQKLELCEKAELLIVETSIPKAFKQLQEYHKQWREIGPVSRDKKEELWDRFKEATAKVNQRQHEHYLALRGEQEENLNKKRELILKVQEINSLTLVKPKKWEEKAGEITEIQKLWQGIGFAPRKENNELYEQFKAECDTFFNAKRAYFENLRKTEQNNLQLKVDLCVQAELLKDSTDWKKTTNEFIKLQKAWKDIGAVPRKHSEVVWLRFRSACDAFFNAKSEHFGELDKTQSENLAKKLELIEKVKKYELTGDNQADIQMLSDYQSQWTEIGFVPFDQKDKIQKEFRSAINTHYNKLDVSLRMSDNFSSKSKGFGDSGRSKPASSYERNKLAVKIRELENEIALYENNIGFFSKSANAENMIRDIQNKIEKAKQTIIELKSKLEAIDKVGNED